MEEEKKILRTELKNNSPSDAKTHNINVNIPQQTSQSNDQASIETAGAMDTANTIEATKSEREILQPSIENMEVHHSSHKHHPKKWKDYLFEFLMLFLAVTAGFLVENKRESYNEHKRAKQFSRQLLADLRTDSTLFENRNKDIQNMQKDFDTLLYRLIQKNEATDKEILEALLPATYVFDIPAMSTTYDQMKTSGSLRYIEKFDLTAHLQQYYDVLLPRCINIAEASLDYFSRNINPFYLKHIRVQDFDSFNDTLVNKNPLIIERTPQTNQELANIMGGYRSLLKIQVISMNDPALKKIKETIAILKEEYHLE